MAIIGQDVSRLAFRVATCAVLVACTCMVSLGMADDAEPAKSKETKTGRPPLIVMKQEEIKGKVFFLTDQGDKRSISSLKIQVYSGDGKKMLYKSKTDKEGAFTLPNLDVGLYKLKIGLLLVELKVEDPLLKKTEQNQIPKAIVVFLPEGMEDLDTD